MGNQVKLVMASEKPGGIIAVMAQEDYDRVVSGEFGDPEVEIDWRMGVVKGLRIFAFASTRRLIRDKVLSGFVTGNHEDWEKLSRHADVSTAPYVYAPFRNGAHYRHDAIFTVELYDFQRVFGERAFTMIFPNRGLGYRGDEVD